HAGGREFFGRPETPAAPRAKAAGEGLPPVLVPRVAEAVALGTPGAERDRQDADARARRDAARLASRVGADGEVRRGRGPRDDFADAQAEERVADHVVVARDDGDT